ncbi:amino acid adenylation domain-containing protein [Actinoplanes sp. CA-252034]|uniref:amino acid adenylation domain-containing protein n=1 Tax=Actinoplanes sp. CA-252034 TaxID=3239906 RepID=UPI003D99A0A2
MNDDLSIAIIGMAGRFPGADDLTELWQVLDEGRETITDYTETELLRAGVSPQQLADPHYVRRGAHIRDAEYFDAAFFGYTGREAELMDPQHRLFLEICHEALERAGHAPGTFPGPVGVYAGTRRSDYTGLLSGPEYDNVTDRYVMAGNEPDALATKVAYKLDCTGPAFTVQTYCSTSLVAVHLAAQQLLDDECDMALAGGVSLRLPQHTGYLYEPGGTRSPEGRCRSFDAAAGGLIFGDGAAVVVLRRLSDALADGDDVLAVIRGSAVTNDGAMRAGYTAPGVRGQSRAVRAALRAAGVDARQVSYVETHGAGTPLGDGVELRALTQGFGAGDRGYCGIGSVKSNLGHLDAASGATALIKTVLALRHTRIPASLHFDLPHPELDLIDSPFYVTAEAQDWEPVDGRRIAGVNSLGIGGTNAHVIVEEAAPVTSGPTAAGRHLLVLSARSAEALEEATGRLCRHLEDHIGVAAADVAFTLQRGRAAYAHRRAFLAADTADAVRALRAGDFLDPGGTHDGSDPAAELGLRWLRGETVDWSALYAGESRRRLPLPTHPMNRRRYWPAPQPVPPAEPAVPAEPAAAPLTEPTTTEPAPAAVPIEEPPMDRLLDELLGLVAASFKMPPEELDPDVPFLEMGADSLLLLSVLQPIQDRYGCKLSMRQFFAEFRTLTELTGYLREHADPQRLPRAEPVAAATPVVAPIPAPALVEPQPAAVQPVPPPARPATVVRQTDGGALERLAMEQIDLMRRQLELLGSAAPAPVSSSNGSPAVAVPQDLALPPAAAPAVTPALVAAPAVTPALVAAPAVTPAPAVPLSPGRRRHLSGPTETEARARYLDLLIRRYGERTAGSKAFAQRFRHRIADSRSTIGFRLSTKEMLYPIVAERGRGARLWDIDGNEYVDLTMGFGVHLFGHQHEPIMAALRERLDVGFGLGPRTELVESVATGILELTGMERVAFVNTGTEAVMTAVRLARAATRREKLVIFSTGYHGHSDGVLASAAQVDGELRSTPIATGVPQGAIDDVYVLEFGTTEALDFIDRHGPELAAVMVEPVMTRHPGQQRPDFLRSLRELTTRHGAKLIFDEMVTGFRSHPGGIQGLYGIEADLATYGKVIGGGLPLGVVAGRGGVMDAIDGGVWNYGDDSFPMVESTYFGGTFCQHPLSMIAARTVLDELRERGPRLQEELNSRTERFVADLNADFTELDVDIRVDRFASLFRFEHEANMDLFFYNLLSRGVYIWEWRACFLSTAHTDADLAFVRAAIRDAIAEMREHGVLAPSTRPTPAPALTPAPATIPANRAQRQLWALANIDETGSLAYHLHAAFWVDGPLNPAALRQAVHGLVDRHESLRTTIEASGENLRIRPAGTYTGEALLLERRAGTEAEVEQICRAEAGRPFDLTEGPLFRVLLIRVGGQRHLIQLTTHHLAGDGWSAVPVLGDLAALYNAAVQKTDPQLPPVAQYRDFLDWQRSQAALPDSAGHRDFWRTLLSGAPELELPTRSRTAPETFTSVRRSLEFDDRLIADLRKAAAANGVTVFAYLVAAWGSLLHRMTGQDDLVVLTPAAGRPGHLGDVVGYCTTLLPLRLRLSESADVGGYVGAVQDQMFDAMDHQSHPFAEVVADLDAAAPGTSRRLFRNVIVLDREIRLPELDGLRLTESQVRSSGYAPWPLFVTLTETGGGFRCDFDINSDAFDAETVDRLPLHYRNMLAAMVADAGRPLREIDYLEAAERAELLAWGRGPVVELGDRMVSELIEDNAARWPDRPAVVFEDRELTYGQFNAEANRLARVLRRRLRVGPETIVGIRLPRSDRFWVTVLALWKCGAAYVPLETRHPLERQLGVLETCAAAGVITDELPDGDPTVPWLLYDEVSAEAAGEEDSDPGVPCPPGAASYVMFSSGSSGVPKGIVIEQLPMLNHILAKNEDYGIDADAVVTQNAPISFDISVWQFFSPLLAGGRVIVYNDQVVEDPARFIAGLDADGVTVVQLVPSYLALMLDELDLAPGGGRLRGLRYVVLGAEPLKKALLERWYQHFPGIPVSNAYGITETSDDVLHPVTPVPDGDVVTTGHPVRNATIYLVDKEFLPVPVGVKGEILVAGLPVGRGYLAPEGDRVHQAFLEHNPVEPGGAARVYRSGDLARWTPDGQLELLGRNDHQVKVRGQRLELGDVERTLHRLEQVRDAVVRNFPDPHDGNYLAAYVVPRAGADADPDSIRNALRGILPDYMVPAYVILLDEYPMTSSGKVDRRALPEPDRTTARRGDQTAQARHYFDDAVLGIARDVLGVDDAGIDDSLFELGGNSISAVRLAQRIRETFKIEMPMLTIFERPVLRDLSDAVAAASFDAYQPIPVAGAKEHYRTSASEERMYFLWTMDPASRLYNIPMAFAVDGPVDPERLRQAVAAVVGKHDILRTVFDIRDGALYQSVLPRVEVPIEDLGRTDETAEELADRWVTPHDLRQGPPIRVALARRTTGAQTMVLLDFPHIVLDEGSMGVLFRDLSAAYRGRPLDRADLTYKDFAEWEQVYRRSEAFARDRAYWLDRLADPPGAVEFPRGTRPAVLTMTGQRNSFRVEPELTRTLRAFCQRQRVTPYMVLLSVFKVLLSKYSGQEDLVVGAPVDGRYHPACSEIVGMFGNSLALRTAPTAGRSFLDYVGEVRRTVLEGLEHQAYPFEDLVRELNVIRDSTRNPLFDFMFVFTDLDHYTFDMDGASGVPEPISVGVAKMDMTLSAYERADTIEVIQEYATEIFDADTVARMGRHYVHLLRQLLTEPDAPLGHSTLVTGDERGRLVRRPADAAADSAGDTLHALFEQAAQAHPDRTALVSGTVRLTYAELDSRANRLANLLRTDLGVSRETPVALMLEQPHDIVTAMLAVLNAGGAYVPVEGSTPPVRVRQMIEDAGIDVMITDLLGDDDLPDGVRLLRPGAPEIAGHPDTRPEPVNEPGDLAYIMFTSGSTGRPKGVLVEHAGVRRIAYRPRYVHVPDDARVLAATSWAFDVSALTMYTALLNGGRLVCATRAALMDTTELRRLIVEEDVTMAFFSTAFFHMLVDMAIDCLDSVTTILAAGERLSVDHARRTVTRLGPGRLINAYGPTEASVYATAHPVDEVGPDVTSVPIGAPVDDTRVYVLLPHGEPAPEGIVGELCIAGTGVARGYLNIENTPDGPFRPDPFVPGDRMYATGDLARILPGGDVEFLGRRDHQVKVRGFRVEPAEIEEALRACAEVTDARVVATEDGPGTEKSLVAYVVTTGAAEPRSLREQLRALIPAYMIPARFVTLDRLPLNSSGKVDLRALHSQSPATEADEERTALTRTETELLALWRDVLDADDLGPHDDFFESGGHSLKAVVLMAEVRDVFGVEVRLVDFFPAPTVHGLARHIDELRSGAALDDFEETVI